MAESLESVSIRLPASYVQLIRRSAENANISVSDFLRPVIIRALDEDPSDSMAEVRHELAASRDAITGLREDVATALAAFLAYLSPLLPDASRKTTEELQKWVAEHFED